MVIGSFHLGPVVMVILFIALAAGLVYIVIRLNAIETQQRLIRGQLRNLHNPEAPKIITPEPRHTGEMDQGDLSGQV
jgi:hypothetical protein